MKQFNKETDLLTRISQVGVRDLDLFVIFLGNTNNTKLSTICFIYFFVTFLICVEDNCNQ